MSNEFLVEAYYENIEAALKEAALYVRANGNKKKAEIDEDTPAMKYHKRRYDELIERVNEKARELVIREVKNPDILFYDFIANTNLYKHKIVKGKRKGEVEERTISSLRISAYRKIIKEKKAKGVPISVKAIEKLFRETKEFCEIV